ncbi:ferric reductase-like transmembrane domain-containing protein [Neobacillus mesonae]|uniref:ferric reductase-like transmembrane domain-containing protein n=1 Tax=Neobacillus mesonae TaxID=1193713 RepID=UPI00203E9C0C|nr:ferric reductase-like transmembrane domain-containing protein [Neobacillus mesonae]MCM3571332.1 ferric reductase-like transmembrane domain-containing protein [Neobacillus mesonae]
MNEYFSIWSLIRTSGFLAYYLLTISLAAGLLSSFSIMKKKKASLITFHQSAGWFGLLTILFHIVLIWQDQYVPYSLQELFIPFAAKNEPILSALGTLSFYMFFLVIASSDLFMKKLGRKKWHRLHYTVIPAWALMIIHGIGIGTDSTEPWALLLYVIGITVVLILGILALLASALAKHASDRQRPAK